MGEVTPNLQFWEGVSKSDISYFRECLEYGIVDEIIT